MKVLVFGSKSVVRKITESLKEIGIELVSLSEMTEVITLLKQKIFALVLVDSLTEEVEKTCQHIRELGTVPLVLIVNSRKADWKRLQPLAVDGYLPAEAGRNELSARLRAMHRRFFMADRLKDFETQPITSDKEPLPIESRGYRLAPNFSETLTPVLQTINLNDCQ